MTDTDLVRTTKKKIENQNSTSRRPSNKSRGFHISKQYFSVCNSDGDNLQAKRLRIRKKLGVKRGT
jgi:hypothetical protein